MVNLATRRGYSEIVFNSYFVIMEFEAVKFDHLKGYRFHSVVESPDIVIFTLFQSRDYPNLKNLSL